MSRYIHIPTILIALILSSMSAYSGNDGSTPQQKKLISGNPLGGAFYENRGQIVDTDGNATPDIKYYAFYNGARVYFTPKGWHTVYTVVDPVDEGVSEATGQIDGARDDISNSRNPLRMSEENVRLYRMDMTLVDCNEHAVIEPVGLQSRYLNYYLPQCSDGITNVAAYTVLRYNNIYNNIDLVLHASAEGLKYEFEVRPGGRVEDIRLRHDGGSGSVLMPDGSLHLSWQKGHTREAQPFSFQEVGSGLSEVKTSYRLDSGDILFEVGKYDAAHTLVIDPWSTFYGGSLLDEFRGIACDRLNAVLVCGTTWSQNFPVRYAWQAVFGGAMDVMVVKFDSSGQVRWATFFGGSASDAASAIAIARDGGSVVVGGTSSINLPHFRAFQTLQHGELDCFIATFDSSGVRLMATYFGGSREDGLFSVGLDAADNIFAAGNTASTSYTVRDAWQWQHGGGGQEPRYDGCYLKMTWDGQLRYSSFFGGNGDDVVRGISVRPDGRFAICGNTTSTNFPTIQAWQPIGRGPDAFVAMFDTSGIPVWSTYHGGSERDYAYGITCTDNGEVLVAGSARSLDFPVLRPWQAIHAGGPSDAYISRFTGQGSLIWSTFYGGTAGDTFFALVTDSAHSVYVSGGSGSSDFPTLNAAYPFQPDTIVNRSPSDCVVVKFDSAGVLEWATYLGGEDYERPYGIALDHRSNLYVTGYTQSGNFPVYNAVQPVIAGTKTSTGYKPDGFITRITSSGRIPVTLSRIAAQRVSGGVELTWRTESEVNAYGFIIERRYERESTTASPTWKDIGFIPSSAQGNEGRDYNYLDTAPGTTNTRIFYRLRMVDLDGTYEHSPVVEVAPEGGALAVSFEAAYPAPARDWLTLNFTLPVESGVSLSVHDITGREITRVYDNQAIPGGSHSVVLPVDEWRSGLYLCTLTAGAVRINRRVMVMR